MVECAGLENQYTCTGIEGSNPSSSAQKSKPRKARLAGATGAIRRKLVSERNRQASLHANILSMRAFFFVAPVQG